MLKVVVLGLCLYENRRMYCDEFSGDAEEGDLPTEVGLARLLQLPVIERLDISGWDHIKWERVTLNSPVATLLHLSMLQCEKLSVADTRRLTGLLPNLVHFEWMRRGSILTDECLQILITELPRLRLCQYRPFKMALELNGFEIQMFCDHLHVCFYPTSEMTAAFAAQLLY